MTKKTILGVLSLFLLIFAFVFFGNMLETVPAGSLVVKQGAIDGKLTVWTTPGLNWQGWGNLTHYKRSEQFTFGEQENGGSTAIKVRFNDYGEALISGSLRYDLPTDIESLKKIHMTYQNQDNLERNLIVKSINSAIYMTGPLMSSTEAASARRSDLLSLAEDQIRFGVYSQRKKDIKVKDSITGAEKTTTVVELIACTTGPKCINGYEREVKSPLNEFNISIYGLTYNSINFEESVKQQIKRQQEAAAAVQEAMANSRKAEQAALTAQKKGEADVATAKAAQAVETANAVGKAEREKAVAILAAQQARETAEQDAKAAIAEKAANIARGEGEAARARLAVAADGALERRINAYVEVNKAWATALTNSTMVPSIIVGSSGTGPSSKGTDLMDLIKAQIARDLNVSLTPKQ